MSNEETWKSLLAYAAERHVSLRLEHVEMMAAAYFSRTDIDPREVVLVEERVSYNRTVFYFSTRGEMGIDG